MVFFTVVSHDVGPELNGNLLHFGNYFFIRVLHHNAASPKKEPCHIPIEIVA